jgi:hypothetical protein
MARLVRISKVVCDTYHLKPMPSLSGDAEGRYKHCVPKRIDDFPTDNLSISNITYILDEEQQIKHSHMLSYDAESILWLLLYWAIQVRPKRGSRDEVPNHIWVNLTGGNETRDPRTNFVNTLAVFDNLCHPDYQPLDDLLKTLFEHLAGYQEYVLRPEGAKVAMALPATPFDMTAVPNLSETEDPRMKPEYLHEVFQRIIFDFIVKNRQEVFMEKKISRSPRKAERKAGMAQPPRRTVRGTETVTRTGTGTGTAGTGTVDRRRAREQEEPEGEARAKRTKIAHENVEEEGGSRHYTRSMGKQYVARTFPRHVGANIPAGTHQIPKRRIDVHYYCIQPRPML